MLIVSSFRTHVRKICFYFEKLVAVGDALLRIGTVCFRFFSDRKGFIEFVAHVSQQPQRVTPVSLLYPEQPSVWK
jgi:hypothetical protein